MGTKSIIFWGSAQFHVSIWTSHIGCCGEMGRLKGEPNRRSAYDSTAKQIHSKKTMNLCIGILFIITPPLERQEN